MTKQSMDELGTISKTASHRISYPDDAVDEATLQRNLNHSPSLDDRYRIFAITCPFHGNAGWRWVRDHDPQGWAETVEFDRAIRHGYPHATKQGQKLRGQYFLHRSCTPLDQVDLDAPARGKRHLQLVTAESTREEERDPDGCSPWSCRSGEPFTGTAARTASGECAA
jgi:hypothetical protein